MMKVLFATSEAAPLIKTGGLADVSGALPPALQRIGVDARVLLPGYPQVLRALESLRLETTFPAWVGYPPSRLFEAKTHSGEMLWILDCPELYQRPGGPYLDEHGRDWADNPRRFGLLSKVAAVLSSAESPLSWRPDVVHCHDWQTGLIPAYQRGMPQAAACVMTIHNLAFQGNFHAHWVHDLGLPWDCFKPDGAEFYGHFSFLKAGLYYADRLTTVSPSYAREIQGDALGFGMQGLLSHRRDVLSGILNGIDLNEWNPSKDPNLVQGYTAKTLQRKLANKRALQQRAGLQTDDDVPLFGMVSRFTYQKGTDLVLEAAHRLMETPSQLVMLGSGDAALQQQAHELAHQYPGRVSVTVGFDEGLSHLIEAGADVFLMPSRFEPCGLNQMYSQRYGTPPIVHATGGLVDSVTDFDGSNADTATGFVFRDMHVEGLLATIRRAVQAFEDKPLWRGIQANGMCRDFGWESSAKAYRAVYEQALAERSAR